jgi:predicted permease
MVCREQDMLADLRLAFRSLSRSPLFTAVAVVSLALGLGVNTAIFSLFDQILLRPMAVRNARELVMLDSPGARRGMTMGESSFSYPMYNDLRDNNQVFSGILARYPIAATLAQPDGQGLKIEGELVSGNYFEVLGVGAHLGRTLTSQDDTTPGAHPVAVISHEFWKSQFASDPAIVGRTVRINGHSFDVAGVAEPGFRGVQPGFFPAVHVPLMMKRQMTPTWDRLFDRHALWLHLFARLKPGVSRERAQAALQPFYHAALEEDVRQLTGVVSEQFKQRFLAKQLLLLDGSGGIPFFRREARGPMIVLLSMVGLVLLIACANVANLLLARAATRVKEVSIRLALGAGRLHLVRQLLAESAVLALLGGLAGLLVAAWTVDALLRWIPQNGVKMNLSAQLDWRILLFSLALSLATGLLFGLLPAWQTTRPDVAPALKDQAASPSRGARRLKKALVAGQVALSLLLLIGSGLFVRSLFNLRAIDPGFRTENLISFRVDAPLAGYKAGQATQVYEQLRERLAALPGVNAAMIAESPLLAGVGWNNRISVEGYPARESENPAPFFNSVSERFFESMGMPLLEGREFTPADGAAAPKVAVVSDRFARYFFGGRSALGRRFGIGDRNQDILIVGVVRDGRATSLRDDFSLRVYVPYRQASGIGGVTFYVRSPLEPESLIRTLRRETGRAFPGLAFFDPKTVRMQIEDAFVGERILAQFCAAFGLLATLLAAVGLYGVMAWSVARRTREIGIRMALGAERARLIRMVLREVAQLTVIGIAIGVPAALGLSRLVRSQLYGITPSDPLTYAGAVALIALVASLAGFLPARRASRVDPLVALRYE